MSLLLEDGSTYCGLGVMSSGDNLEDVVAISHISRKIDYFKEVIILNEDNFHRAFNIPKEKELKLTVVLDKYMINLYHKKTKSLINLNTENIQ